MTRIGSWWLTSVPALEAEVVERSWLANRSQSPQRAVGGKLFVTNQRLVFLPHRLDQVTGGESWTADRRSVAAVGIRPAGGGAFGGGLRDRLMLRTTDGQEHLFVINSSTEVVADLRARLGTGP